jgi:4-amino-4-deoxy-L-arabinose transferase-like glycosyltransferase
MDSRKLKFISHWVTEGLQSNSFQSCPGEGSSTEQDLLREGRKKPSRIWFGLLIFTLTLQIFSVWNCELSGPDSPRTAGIAREMAVSSNYLIPRLNGENFLEYPSLGYWPIALILSMSQKPADFLAFLPIVFLGTGTVLITFLIGKILAGEQIGLMAGFILSTTSGFVSLHRHCWVDPTLLFFITLSLYGFAGGYHTPRKSFFFFALFYLAMAGAFLSKGVIGVAIPIGTAVMVFFSRKNFTAIWKLILSPGILLFLVPTLLWIGSVWRLEGSGIFEEVIRQSLSRFFSPSADHAEPFYFYFVPTFLHLMPWTLLPLVIVWRRSKHARLEEALNHDSLIRFALVWFLIVFIGLSLSSAKRPVYLGPIYPPFALLAALGWNHIREKFPRVKNLEFYGLTVIFLVYIGTYLFFITPSERKQSFQPIFKVVASQQTYGPVYLINPSERLRGAAFFYLGKRTPVLNDQDFLLGRFENRPETTFVINSLCDNTELLSNLLSKGYRLVLEKQFRKIGVCVYSNSPSLNSMILPLDEYAGIPFFSGLHTYRFFSRP